MNIRVLVAFEDPRSLYRELLVRAIRDWRPTLIVRSASVEKLVHELLRFAPHVVVCSRPVGDFPAGSGAWIQVPTDGDARRALICLDGERRWTEGPHLWEVLGVIEEAQERLEVGRLSGSC